MHSYQTFKTFVPGKLLAQYSQPCATEKEKPRPTIIPEVVLTVICTFSVEYGVAKQLCERVQRGIEYADLTNMWDMKHHGKRTLVVSGGVASNTRIRSSLKQVS